MTICLITNGERCGSSLIYSVILDYFKCQNYISLSEYFLPEVFHYYEDGIKYNIKTNIKTIDGLENKTIYTRQFVLENGIIVNKLQEVPFKHIQDVHKYGAIMYERRIKQLINLLKCSEYNYVIKVHPSELENKLVRDFMENVKRIFLKREDDKAQFLSYVISLHIGVWNVDNPAKLSVFDIPNDSINVDYDKFMSWKSTQERYSSLKAKYPNDIELTYELMLTKDNKYEILDEIGYDDWVDVLKDKEFKIPTLQIHDNNHLDYFKNKDEINEWFKINDDELKKQYSNQFYQ